ncbi:unnamed protein product [Heterobilharzia americana]|nr:unnamed protein product [Heterobilharzia americana]CAH8621182.1 unnamed protein product [Heterobilharzia americana]
MSTARTKLLSIKFFINEPGNGDNTVYRWMAPVAVRHLEWDKVIKKLHFVTHKKYGGFEMTWYDGFHHCVLTNTKDLRKAVEHMQIRGMDDNCVHIHVKAIPAMFHPEPNSQSNDDSQFSGQYLPCYLEAINHQSINRNRSSEGRKMISKQDPVVIRQNRS